MKINVYTNGKIINHLFDWKCRRASDVVASLNRHALLVSASLESFSELLFFTKAAEFSKLMKIKRRFTL